LTKISDAGLWDVIEESLELVASNTDPAWREEAERTIIRVASRLPEFTTEDIWEAGLQDTHNNKALGPVILSIARRGLIRQTNPTRYRRSTMTVNHGRPMSIWVSNICEGYQPELMPKEAE
jgi:hypothetical protein